MSGPEMISTFGPPSAWTEQSPERSRSWTILVVDDDEEVHSTTRFMLRSEMIYGRKLELLHARSTSEALRILENHAEIAVALIDVVMETDDAGLQLVRGIRARTALESVRLIIRTGQPGLAPEADIVSQYDINDYRTKTELSQTRLMTSLTVAIRSYIQIRKFIRVNQELEESRRRMEQLAVTDGLTALVNRRYFDEQLIVEWARARRTRSTLALMMADVDHFKDYNDTYGHPAGDVCLRRIADCLQSVLHRAGDVVARYGGEEFAVILPATDYFGAGALATQMRDAVLALKIPHSASPVASVVTISIGVAAAEPTAHDPNFPEDSGEDLAELLMYADHALYQAKRSGRNRIILHESG
ncbi:MAG: diguanylate cyclase [bacterium]|nr:diguanylate cyclase [bacterium]